MKFVLDSLFRLCNFVAAALVVGITILISAQIVGRMFGILIPSADEIAGLALASLAFLALAPVLRAGGHVRVTILFERVSPQTRRYLQIICLLVALAVAVLVSWSLTEMAWTSWQYGTVIVGLLQIPVWPYQSAMAFGAACFSIALLEEAFRIVMRGESGSPNDSPPSDVRGRR